MRLFAYGRQRTWGLFLALADEPRGGLLRLENGNWAVLFLSSKDGVKDCFKLPSYDLTGAQSPRCNTAWILDPASHEHLSSKRDTSLDQSGKSPRNSTLSMQMMESCHAAVDRVNSPRFSVVTTVQQTEPLFSNYICFMWNPV